MNNTETKGRFVDSWISFKYNLCNFLPLLMILFLILLVYVCYLVFYITVLLNANNYTDDSDYPFSMTSSKDNALIKGICLFIAVTFFFALLMISLGKTVLLDPGYFTSVFNAESRISTIQGLSEMNKKNNITVSKNQLPASMQEILEQRIEFLNKFNSIITSTPLNAYENKELSDTIVKMLTYRDADSNHQSGLQEFRINQAKLKAEGDSIFDLDNHFKSIDVTKMMFCANCLRYKVDRSHHCRVCGKCVLKMDHHCPWLANCVGFRNYKFFLLIHFHGICANLLILGSYWEAMVNYNGSTSGTLVDCWLTVWSYLCALGLLGYLLWLFIINWKLVFTGQTIIENSDRERFTLNKSPNIYDLGCLKNFKSVFGNNPLTWFLPFYPNYNGEGLIYETMYNKIKYD